MKTRKELGFAVCAGIVLSLVSSTALADTPGPASSNTASKHTVACLNLAATLQQDFDGLIREAQAASPLLSEAAIRKALSSSGANPTVADVERELRKLIAQEIQGALCSRLGRLDDVPNRNALHCSVMKVRKGSPGKLELVAYFDLDKTGAVDLQVYSSNPNVLAHRPPTNLSFALGTLARSLTDEMYTQVNDGKQVRLRDPSWYSLRQSVSFSTSSGSTSSSYSSHSTIVTINALGLESAAPLSKLDFLSGFGQFGPNSFSGAETETMRTSQIELDRPYLLDSEREIDQARQLHLTRYLGAKGCLTRAPIIPFKAPEFTQAPTRSHATEEAESGI